MQTSHDALREAYSLRALLAHDRTYSVPPYQRQYQWDEERWHAVAYDVMDAYTTTHRAHWLGVILLSLEPVSGQPHASSHKSYRIVDGQQRLVTVLAWIAALVHHAAEAGEPCSLSLSDLATVKVQDPDSEAMAAVLAGDWLAPLVADKLKGRAGPMAAYYYFRWLLWLGRDSLLSPTRLKQPLPKARLNRESLLAFWETDLQARTEDGLKKSGAVDAEALLSSTLDSLTLTSILHDPAHDEPEAVVFDTLNGKRMELEPLDHVRSSMFVRVVRSRADELHRTWWKPVEDRIRKIKSARTPVGRLFLYDWLIMKGQNRHQGGLNAARGAVHFGVLTRGMHSNELEAVYRDDLVPSMACWPFVMGMSRTVELKGEEYEIPAEALEARDSIRSLTSNPLNPIALLATREWMMNRITTADFVQTLRIAEAWLGRHILNGTRTNNLRRMVMDLMDQLREDASPNSVAAAVMAARWPEKKEILENCEGYMFSKRLRSRAIGAILQAVENGMTDGALKFPLGTRKNYYSIEHIYPQDAKQWARDLRRWKVSSDSMNGVLHLLGNLTVVTNQHNSSMRNGTFDEKKASHVLAKKSAALSLNGDWVALDQWDPDAVRARTKRLVKAALRYWALPVSG